MKVQVLTALISAIVALILAVFNTIKSIILSRNSSENCRKLEILKHYLEIEDAELRKILESLKDAIRLIQRIKDEIHIVIMSVDNSLEPKSTLDQISQAINELVLKYQNSVALLDDREMKSFHRAKCLSVKILPKLNNIISLSSFSWSLPDQLKGELASLRSELTEEQLILRDCISDRLMRRSLNYE